MTAEDPRRMQGASDDGRRRGRKRRLGRARPVDQPPPVVEADPPTKSIWARIDRPFVFGFLVTLGGLAALLLGFALSSLSEVLIYIAFALFAALGLDPIVRWLERHGVKRALAVVIVILGFAIVLALVVMSIVPIVVTQIAQFATSFPQTIAAFQHTDLYHLLEKQFGPSLHDLVAQLQSQAQKFLSDPKQLSQLGGGALKVGGAIASGLSGALIVIVLTLYFLATLPGMQKGLLQLAPARNRKGVDHISTQIIEAVGGYVMGMVILAFINAVIVLILYLVFGLPFPPLMATLAFLITLIPLVGPLLFLVLGSVVALFVNPLSALLFAIIYLVYIQIEAYVITPRVMNRAISIPGSLVVIGALVGGTLLGLLGALIAVPVTASILIIVKQVWIPRQDARV